jgi:hypothetical protein
MAEQLIKKNTNAIRASSLGMKLISISLMRNSQLNVLHGKTEIPTAV